MKIAMLTFQQTTNYGALLQAMALQKKLRDEGAACDIIDYRCENIARRELPGSYLACRSLQRIALTAIKRRKLRHMTAFARKYMQFTDCTYTRETVAQLNEQYDRFVAGSDMIWEMDVIGHDTSYYLDFVRDDSRKYAFSSSFGYDEVPEAYRAETAALLARFHCISVREREGAAIVRALTGREVPVTLDPTLLLTGDEWRAYAEPIKRRKPYVLVYFNDKENVVMNYARQVAAAHGWDVIQVCDKLRGVPGVKTLRGAAVERFLGLLAGAAMVVTSSYHGLAFAINFHVPFYCYNRTHLGRIHTLLNALDMQQRRITGKERPDAEEQPIDWGQVEEKLSALRHASLDRLRIIAGTMTEHAQEAAVHPAIHDDVAGCRP